MIRITFFLFVFFTSITIHAQQLAFPNADGYGKYSYGGRGGKVLVVDNLNDSGAGSLRHAVEQTGARIIVFRVSGYINLESPLNITNDSITIAGQTAPGSGITLRYYPLKISASHVTVRYIRSRLGDVKNIESDAASGRYQHDVILDHCSFSWATDECASFYRNKNFTMQWCMITESLNQSVHHKGSHGYGGIWGGVQASFHHNLFAHHTSRNPRFSGSYSTPNDPAELVDFRNNVIYNWGFNSTYGGERSRYNMVANYYKPGPATRQSVKERIVNPSKTYGHFYVADNIVYGSEEVTKDNWNGGVQCDSVEFVRSDNVYETIKLESETAAQEAYELVLKNGGASYSRDAVDERIVNEVKNGSATFGENGIINSQEEVGGWPELVSAKAPLDTDKDGMPDAWEIAKGLNARNAQDASLNNLHEYYTNIEVYINEIIQ